MPIRYRSMRRTVSSTPGPAMEALEQRSVMASLPLVTLSLSDASCAESPANIGEFRIRRTGILDEPLTVRFQISGDATNGVDYVGLAMQIRIPAGRRVAKFPIIPIDDLEVEQGPGGVGEQVRVTLLADAAAYRVDTINDINTSRAITILDNDRLPVVTVFARDPLATELGDNTARFTIRRTGGTELPLTVTYFVAGSATNDDDYEQIPTSITLPVGKRTATIIISPFNDMLTEGDETVRLTLRPGVGFSLLQSDASQVSTYIIIADRPMVTLFVSDPFGSQFPPDTASFTIHRTGSTAASLRISYLLSGTATPGVEFVRLPSTLTIPAGASTLTVFIRGLDSELTDGFKTVTLTLRRSNDYNLNTLEEAYSVGTVMILDNTDPQP